MTLRDGGYLPGICNQEINSSDETTIRNGYDGYAILSATGAFNTFKFWNMGYYSVGSTWEFWPSTTAPSAINPSGHSLTNYQYIEIQ